MSTKDDMSVCAIGKVDDGTLRVCCSTHRHVLCAHHYARTHFVETMPAHDTAWACNATSDPTGNVANEPDDSRPIGAVHSDD